MQGQGPTRASYQISQCHTGASTLQIIAGKTCRAAGHTVARHSAAPVAVRCGSIARHAPQRQRLYVACCLLSRQASHLCSLTGRLSLVVAALALRCPRCSAAEHHAVRCPAAAFGTAVPLLLANSTAGVWRGKPTPCAATASPAERPAMPLPPCRPL